MFLGGSFLFGGNMKLKTKIWLGIFIILMAFNFLRSTDDTDKSRWTRSGLVLYTDYATGIQYVKGGLLGGLSPRLNSEGKIMRSKK